MSFKETRKAIQFGAVNVHLAMLPEQLVRANVGSDGRAEFAIVDPANTQRQLLIHDFRHSVREEASRILAQRSITKNKIFGRLLEYMNSSPALFVVRHGSSSTVHDLTIVELNPFLNVGQQPIERLFSSLAACANDQSEIQTFQPLWHWHADIKIPHLCFHLTSQERQVKIKSKDRLPNRFATVAAAIAIAFR